MVILPPPVPVPVVLIAVPPGAFVSATYPAPFLWVVWGADHPTGTSIVTVPFESFGFGEAFGFAP